MDMISVGCGLRGAWAAVYLVPSARLAASLTGYRLAHRLEKVRGSGVRHRKKTAVYGTAERRQMGQPALESDVTRVLESQARLRCAELAAEDSFADVVRSVIEQLEILGTAPVRSLAALSADELRSHVAQCEQALACLCQEYGVRRLQSVEARAPELFPEYDRARRAAADRMRHNIAAAALILGEPGLLKAQSVGDLEAAAAQLGNPLLDWSLAMSERERAIFDDLLRDESPCEASSEP